MVSTESDETPAAGSTLVKYNKSGNLLWKHSYIGAYPYVIDENTYGELTVDSNGTSFLSLAYLYLPSIGLQGKLLKYDPNGNLIWAKGVNGDNQTGIVNIMFNKLDPQGHLIALGFCGSNEDEIDNYLFVAAYDTANGEEIWRHNFPGYFWPQQLGILDDRIEFLTTVYKPDGSYFRIGQYNFDGTPIQEHEKPYLGWPLDFNYITKSGDIILGSRSGGYTVTRVSPEGDTIWHYKYPLSNNSINRTLGFAEDENGNIYATGGYFVDGQDYDLATTKFTSAGIILWQKSYHARAGMYYDVGQDIKTTSKYAIAIGSSSIGADSVVLSLLFYDRESGNQEFEISISEDISTIGVMTLPVENLLFYSGLYHHQTEASTSIITGCFQIPGMSPVHNINNVQEPAIFPNPFKDEIWIQVIDYQIFKTCSLTDINGVLLHRQNLESSETMLNISSMPSGTYILTLSGPGIRLNKKIIKTN